MNNLFYIFLGIGVLLISFFPLYDLVWKLINYLFFPDKPHCEYRTLHNEYDGQYQIQYKFWNDFYWKDHSHELRENDLLPELERLKYYHLRELQSKEEDKKRRTAKLTKQSRGKLYK